MKIALAMIVKGDKDEARRLAECLNSVAHHVDGIFLDINAPKGKRVAKEAIEVAKKFKADYVETVWTGNFVKARNDNFARVPKDYDFILWLDADDTVINPEKIKSVLAVLPQDYHGLYIDYKYDFDSYGNVTVHHWVARIVRNNDTYHWKSSFSDGEQTVHETLVEKRGLGTVRNEEFWVEHHTTEERKDSSLERNTRILEQMYEKSKDDPDPRIVFYLATHYMDGRNWMQAKLLFEQYLKLSGWAEERSQAYVYLGDIYKAMGDNNTARGCYMRALADNPSDPSPYVELGQLELDSQLWEKAIDWLEMAVNKKPKITTIVLRPMDNTYRAYKLLANAYANLDAKGLTQASKWLNKALELRPTDPELVEARQKLDKLMHVRKLNEAALTLFTELRENRELEKLIPFTDNLPKDMQDSPLALNIRNYYAESTYWEKDTVAIVCGPSALGHWGPWSIDEGIGGSEEAVIQLSQELTKLGWKVTVFATPGDKAGEYDGVKWEHYWKFNSRDTFDVLIGWRSPNMFDKAFKARKRYLWLHDVVESAELTPERLDNIEKVIFVSQYHRDLYPEISDKKCLVSGNGIVAADFAKLDGKIKRNPKRVVYMSAHERGQQLLQQIWRDVIKEVPDAELHCYYGWAGYDHINRNNPERMQWKEELIKDGESLQNFTDHGKINHQQIVEEIFKSGIWAYPTGFPEVYCITGVKAQAGGAWPVISNFAALKETVPFGDKIDITETDQHIGKWQKEDVAQYTKLLISALQNPPSEEDRQEMMTVIRTTRDWKNTAEQWHEDFKA